MATSSASSSDTRRLFAEAVRRREAERSGGPGSTLRWLALGAVILALLVGFLLWIGGFFTSPRPIRELRSLVDEQVKELDRVARNEVPFSADMAPFGPLFERMRDLPADLREQARDEMERLFRARERAEMKSYFALPAAARQAELDRRIKAEEDRRKAREAERAKRNADQPAGNQTASNRPQRGGGPGGPAGGGGRGPGGPGGPGGGRGAGEDQRNSRSKQRIDASSPTERSQRAEYRRAMDARREQLGGSPGGRRP